MGRGSCRAPWRMPGMPAKPNHERRGTVNRFRITVEALDADPGNEGAGYIADTSTLTMEVAAESNFNALERAAHGNAVLT
jgi:hypothetical protein